MVYCWTSKVIAFAFSSKLYIHSVNETMKYILMFSEPCMLESLNLWSINDPALCPNGCGVSFKGVQRKKNLKKHISYVCGVSPKFQCMFCQKKFKQNDSRKYHMVTFHHQSIQSNF